LASLSSPDLPAKARLSTLKLRVIVSCEQGFDGLVYEVLECQHRVLLIAGVYGSVTSSRRHCPRCPRKVAPTGGD
jgi:hypothetical protein